MERYTIYLALDSSGLEKFHYNQQRTGVKHEFGLCNFVGNQSKYFAVVCPPEFAEGICNDEKQTCDIPAGLFCWEEEKKIGSLQFPNSTFNRDTELTQDAWEFVADCVHKLCDELPTRGNADKFLNQLNILETKLLELFWMVPQWLLYRERAKFCHIDERKKK